MKNALVIFSVFLLSTFLSSQEINQNVKNFSQLPDVYDVKISPNGKMVGVLREIDQERMVSIIELESKKMLHTHRFIRKYQIQSFEWLSDERLLFSRSAKFSGENRSFASGELYATNIDGKKSIMEHWVEEEFNKKKGEGVKSAKMAIKLAPNDPTATEILAKLEQRIFIVSQCFIATAAHGTPFNEDIDVLRAWRDKFLMNSLGGKIFVKNYYRYSPPVANLISASPIAKKIVRNALVFYM